MSLKQNGSGYMVQLDGLRAIAVAVVVLFHWTPEVKQTGLGGLGVQLFFVLSGYLITGILLDARSKAETIGSGMGQIVKSFYARRFLRIFPLYYLVIVLAALLGSVNVLNYLPWHLGYLSNIAIYLQGIWIGEASHLWSLAVEEQFYLLWPFVILFTPKRYLTATVIGFILLAPAFKLTCMLLEVGGSRLGVLPISSFHYLGAGALLTILQKRFSNQMQNTFAKRVQLAGIVGFLVFALLRLFADRLAAVPVMLLVQEFATIALFLSLTLGAAQGYKGKAGCILSSKPMVYVGQISYGLYLFHNFIPYFLNKLFQQYKLDTSALGTGGSLLLHGLILVIISSFSWHFLESRLNNYKRYFPYVQVSTKQEKKLEAR